MTREAHPMPFAAQRRHQYWLVDVRYVEDYRVGVVAAFTGDELTRQFGEFQQQATELVQ